MTETEKKEITELIKNEIWKLIPIGSIQAFAMEKAPDGWLICDGQELLIEAYRELFNVIGTAFGGDGMKSFCLPDLRGQFVRGWDLDGNIDPERKFGSYQDDALQGHGHDVNSSAIKINDSGDHVHCPYRIHILPYLLLSANKGIQVVSEGTIDGTIDELLIRGSVSKYSPSGSHSHSININQSKPFITNVRNGKYGQVKCDVETHPKNLALLYCIKV